MKINQNKLIRICCLLLIVFIPNCILLSELEARDKENVLPTRIDQIIVSPLDKLFQWPVSSIMNGPNRIDSNSVDLVTPKNQCLTWLKIIFDPSWLPAKDPELIFIKDEFENRDVVHATWDINDYKLEVSQTASICAIKVTPLGSRNTGIEISDKIRNAQNICLEMFNKNGYRWNADGDKVTIGSLNQKIANYSFNTESVKLLKDDQSVWGTPQTMHEAGTIIPKDDMERRRQMDPNYPDWDNSSRSFSYWFRNVTWWNNGKSIGFYFLKVEGGSWQPSYDANFDKNFFGR